MIRNSREERPVPGQPAYVIVGASLAGAKAAETLREEGFDGAVVMIGEENDRPYERPPLSKGYLLGNDERESIFVHPEGWYAENRRRPAPRRPGHVDRPDRPDRQRWPTASPCLTTSC